MVVVDRFIEKLEAGRSRDGHAGCWIWTRNLAKGYGLIQCGGKASRKSEYAHRVAWRAANGEIPAGMSVLHKCDNPICVNPAHLFLGTQADNMRDMAAKGRTVNQNTNKTHCYRGHELIGANLKIETDGARRCRECARIKLANFRKRRREKQ